MGFLAIGKVPLYLCVTYLPGRFRDYVERCRIFNRCRSAVFLPVGNLSHGCAEDLSGPGLGEPGNGDGALEAGQRTDLISHHLHQFSRNFIAVATHTGFQDEEGDGDLALELVFDTDDGTFGHIGMLGDHFLHGPGREPVPCHIDDVIDPAHDVDVSIFVEVAAVSGEIISRDKRSCRILETSDRFATRWEDFPEAEAA